ncbi:cupin domain-containing protein [Luteirhabdus pelagi]|uniref:cupin domain-containing protein n=1 Tax=Luteirhabdus pelagi TaxID=2792783 RepID=UPI00193A7F35|nr:cupin domain-containing protein [Luteirhabdus pelagi]
MKKNIKIIFSSVAIVAITLLGCEEKSEETNSSKELQDEKVSTVENEPLFPEGNVAPAKYFTGTAKVYGLVSQDSVFTTNAGNVRFEKGARSNWHSHPSGQILIVTEGVGYHQIKGQSKETIRKGDVIKCPPNTTHWHGASEDSAMTHIYIVPNTEKGVVDWKDPVTDEEYLNQ